MLAGLLLSACGGGDERGEAAPWEGPPAPARDGTIDVRGFNDHAEAVDASWRKAPLPLAIEFLGLDDREPSPALVEVAMPPEARETARVTVTFDRLLDDSVRARRYVLALARADDGRWRVTSARHTQRCHAGRGHEEFTPTDCV